MRKEKEDELRDDNGMCKGPGAGGSVGMIWEGEDLGG